MRETTLPHLIHAGARERPDAVFLEEVTGRKLSYEDTERLGLRWAGALEQAKVKAGDTVLTMLACGIDAVCCWLGLGLLRAIDVGVSLEYKGALLRDLILDSRARVMVTQRKHVPTILDALAGGECSLRTLIVVDAEARELRSDPRIELNALGDLLAAPKAAGSFPEHYDIACLTYTSGTTGRSKGVLVPWAQMHATCMGSIELYGAGDAYYSPFPMNHASGRLPLYFMALVGGRVVFRERFSASAFWEDVRRFGCTTTSMPGTIAAMLLAQEPRTDDADNPLRFVTLVPLIGELDRFRRRFDVQVRTMFNQTELSSPIVSAGTKLADERSCGRLRSGYEARLVDEHDEPVGAGQVGELIVRADRPWTMMAGYHGRPDATAEAWRNGWFHTGDLFTCDADGNFYYVDRRKDCIRRRGENISSVELEMQVKEHPDVLEAAAIGVPAELGEEEIKIVVVPRAGSSIDPVRLHGFLAERLPSFMVPRYIEVALELPRTVAMQRVQKARLREAGVTPATWDSQR